MRIRGDRSAGFTLVEMMIVVAVIGLLLAIALPEMDLADKRGEAAKCKAQLQAIEVAAEASAMDNGSWPTTTTELVGNGYLRQNPQCEWAGATHDYQISTVAQDIFTFQDGSTTLSTKYPSGTAFCPIHGTIKEFREDGVTAVPVTGEGGGGPVVPPE